MFCKPRSAYKADTILNIMSGSSFHHATLNFLLLKKTAERLLGSNLSPCGSMLTVKVREKEGELNIHDEVYMQFKLSSLVSGYFVPAFSRAELCNYYSIHFSNSMGVVSERHCIPELLLFTRRNFVPRNE